MINDHYLKKMKRIEKQNNLHKTNKFKDDEKAVKYHSDFVGSKKGDSIYCDRKKDGFTSTSMNIGTNIN
jgi:hypothetical protein